MANLTDQQILQQFGAAIIAAIKENAAQQDRNATGRATSELREDVTSSELKVIDGAGYTQWGWEYGRGPGKFPPLAKLIEWVRARGLAQAGKEKSLAFLIGRKIAREGSVLFRKGGKSGVITNVITLERIESVAETFATKYLNQIKSEVVRDLQQ